MKKILTLAILTGALSAPLFAQDTNSKGTPDSITEFESMQLPAPVEPHTDLTKAEQQFFAAAYKGSLAEVEKFVAKGTDVNLQDEKKRTPLILAAHGGHTDVVAYLIKQGADVNLTDSGGRSPLLYVAKRPFNETAALLLENGADANIQSSKKGVTALMIAAVANNDEMVEMLLAHGADASLTDIFGRTARILAELKGNSTVVAMLPETPEQVSEQ